MGDGDRLADLPRRHLRLSSEGSPGVKGRRRRSPEPGEVGVSAPGSRALAADLAIPFDILALAHERLGARAVASAAWSLYVSERNPSDLERTDKLLYLSAAVESICDIGAHPENQDNRWGRLSDRYGVWRDLAHHYSQLELKEAKRLASDIRNITAHGSDDVLINLGYPPEATRPMPRGRTLTGEQLALARAAAILPILGVAVRGVIEKVAEEGAEHGWDDDWFTGLFEATAPEQRSPDRWKRKAPLLTRTFRRLKRRSGGS